MITVLDAREAVRMMLPDRRIGHAELTVGNAVISVGLAAAPTGPTEHMTRHTLRSMTLVFVTDVDHAARCAVNAGGTLIEDPTDQPWGLRQAIVADPEDYCGSSAHTCVMYPSTHGAHPNSTPYPAELTRRRSLYETAA